MKRKPANETGEQNTEQQPSGQQSNPAAPPAAAKADVQKLREETVDEIERLESEIEDLRAENEELRSEKDELREALAKIDRLVNKVYEMGATRDGEPPLNSDMTHMMPENKEDDGEIPIPFGGENDG